MAERRKFLVVIVGPGRGVGETVSTGGDSDVEYSGKSVEIALSANRH